MHQSADILSLSRDEFSARLAAIGEKSYRAVQIIEWIYERQACSFEEMSSLPRSLRDRLAAEVPFPQLTERGRKVSSDGTVKFLFELADGQMIETVFIPTEKRSALCISSQAGCKFGCGFCASGLGGWKRNLSAGEIVAQVLRARRAVAPEKVTHIVFMGVGEPFDNYDNVLKAARLLNAADGGNIAARRITISTCGLVPGIKRLAEEGLQIELSVSLHAPNDRLRSQLMPVNKKYPLRELMPACRAYAKETNRQVTFEYILIKDLTCTPAAAAELAALMRGWLSKVNLIPYNPVAEFPYATPAREAVFAFRQELERWGVICTLRSPRGRDVGAACGQLRLGAGKRD
ncbi:MAG: 23S rRNA (adenine(2503)-C(2))-methyltransferase RlmN [Candidatus Omnitrophica bacterium]|nr:23S rRNA (adenine(2503)-C(2))-methyltransferase RlmN [Candidatus Omnitrophota bacterium]